MTSIQRELYELANIHSDHDPVISLYLDARAWDPRRREILRLFVQERLAEAREAWADDYGEAFERTLDRLEDFCEGLYRQAHDQDVDGIAIFACEALGLWKVFRFPHRLRNEFSLGSAPNLLQLVRYARGFQPALVVQLDAEGAWVFETELGRVESEARFSQEIYLRRATGEMAEPYHQRHVEQQIEWFYAEPAKRVSALLDRDPSLWLILAGTPRQVALFEKVLPTRAKDRILARLPAPGVRGYREGEIREQLVSRAVEEVYEYERQREEETVAGVAAEALAGGLAELGPEDVVLAANEGRVHRLLVEDGLEQVGARCTNCDALMMRATRSCMYCGQEVEDVSLAEELTRRVIRDGGTVEVLAPHPLLHHYAGVAAVLRNRGSAPMYGSPP